MKDEAVHTKLAKVLDIALSDSTLSAKQRAEFSRNLVASYLALTKQPDLFVFNTSQLEPMRLVLKQGLKIETLIAALDKLGERTKELLEGRQASISFATIIAKMVAAQANLLAAG